MSPLKRNLIEDAMRHKWALICQDITESHAHDVEYTKLIQEANAPILGIDMQGNIDFWNKKISDLTGYAPDMITGDNLLGMVYPPDRVLMEEILSKAARATSTSLNFPCARGLVNEWIFY